MLILLLGILDILAGISLLLLKFSMGYTIAAFFTIYLLVKGVAFITNWTSWVDLTVVAIFILALFGNFNLLTYVAVVWLLQKGIFSLF